MASNLKLALVGCGAIARFHLDGIKEHVPRIEVTALIDRDLERAEEMAKDTGGRAFTSLDEALAKGDFDAVDIMLPHHLHEEAALKCFEAGNPSHTNTQGIPLASQKSLNEATRNV